MTLAYFTEITLAALPAVAYRGRERNGATVNDGGWLCQVRAEGDGACVHGRRAEPPSEPSRRSVAVLIGAASLCR
jgi:hypothetical protein